MDKYYVGIENTRTKALPQINIDRRIVDFLMAIWAIISSAAAKKVYKITACAACMVAFIGVIGAIELCSLPLIWGVIICAVLTLAELAVLRSLARTEEGKQ